MARTATVPWMVAIQGTVTTGSPASYRGGIPGQSADHPGMVNRTNGDERIARSFPTSAADPANLAVRGCVTDPVSRWIMADNDALRSRRKRLHAAGDHRLCRRCDARGAV